MTRKNINVSEVVHEKLSLLKQKEETFDDVMKRELGIFPAGLEELTSFYPDRLTGTTIDLVNHIKDQAELEETITEYEDYYALEFDHPDSNHTIVQVQFQENPTEGMHALYRNHHGEMQTLVEAFITKEDTPNLPDELNSAPSSDLPVFIGPDVEDKYGAVDTEIIPEEHILPRLESKIRGSYERWG
jgi:hypothetical protein